MKLLFFTLAMGLSSLASSSFADGGGTDLMIIQQQQIRELQTQLRNLNKTLTTDRTVRDEKLDELRKAATSDREKAAVIDAKIDRASVQLGGSFFYAKDANNGTATCAAYCAAWPEHGPVGVCVTGYESGTRNTVGCFATSTTSITCICHR